MYGVVLWSDPHSDRALIWCEDHGSLAFYHAKPNENEKAYVFESGDLVRFSLRETADMRYAEALEVVATEEYPSLARQLQRAGAGDHTAGIAARMAKAESNIVPFDLSRCTANTVPFTGPNKVAVR